MTRPLLIAAALLTLAGLWMLATAPQHLLILDDEGETP